jgi:hypothetical protein
MPYDGSPLDKFELNYLGRADDNPVIGIRIARANHTCRPNAYHFFETATRAMLLLTSAPIAKGDEINISYTNCMTASSATSLLQAKWGVFCPDGCACKSSSWVDQMAWVAELDQQATDQLTHREGEEALRGFKDLLLLKESLQSSASTTTLTLYDCFQAAIALGHVPEALSFVKQAFALAEQSFGPASEKALKYKTLVEDPMLHDLYAVLCE